MSCSRVVEEALDRLGDLILSNKAVFWTVLSALALLCTLAHLMSDAYDAQDPVVIYYGF